MSVQNYEEKKGCWITPHKITGKNGKPGLQEKQKIRWAGKQKTKLDHHS